MALALTPPSEVLGAYFAEAVELTALTAGHINDTFVACGPTGRVILQRLNPIFSPRVNEDIAALTPHIGKAGLACPQLVRTLDGALWATATGGATWRCLTFLPGETYLTADDPCTAFAAGEFLARFHLALRPVHYDFVAQRLAVHDTDAHIAGLRAALQAHRQHPAHAAVAEAAREPLAMLCALPSLPPRPKAIVHGDAKLSNFLFADPEHATALVDLDTLGEMELALELGDALRSWTNQPGSAGAGPQLSRAHYTAALSGYAHGSSGALAPADVDCLAVATLRISLELTVRFLRDSLEERYFAWDHQKHAHAHQQHLPRALAQLAYARSLHDSLSWARDAAREAFASASGGHQRPAGH